jgi:hypothetical protein
MVNVNNNVNDNNHSSYIEVEPLIFKVRLVL